MYATTISGKRISMTYGGGPITIVGLVEMTFDPQVDELDATTGADLGYGDVDTGVMQAVVEIKIIIDVDANPYPTLFASTLLTNVALYRDPALNIIPIVDIPYLKILSSPTTAQVRGRWEATIRGKSRGVYTINSGG